MRSCFPAHEVGLELGLVLTESRGPREPAQQGQGPPHGRLCQDRHQAADHQYPPHQTVRVSGLACPG